MKIYTKTGDDGTTGLLSGGRVYKDSLRVEAYGCVDEINSALGVARSLTTDTVLNETILDLQKLLMLIMAELAQAESNATYIKNNQIEKIENDMDNINAKLPPLKGFIIPGNSSVSAALDLSRTICRRAERQIWRLARQEPVSESLLILMNRLSDYCFLLARNVDENR